MENKENTFTYTYSANQHDEVEKIRKKYLPKEEDKMEQLRSLDQQATKRGSIIAIVLGTISALVLGIGMCCTMLWSDFFVVGVVIGLAGIAGAVLAYPLYSHIIAKDRKKIAPQIMELSNELVK